MGERRSLVRTRGTAARARAPGAEALTCADCGREALDVRIDRDGEARCFAGVGCQGKAYRARGAS